MFLRLNKLPFSHNHHHHRNRLMSEADLASLQAFRSLVSQNINRVLGSLKLGSDILSLTWIQKCFEMLPMINNAFAKLMVELDYPVGSWEAGSIDEYLDYTISLLEILNSISSSICHVNHACVSLTHAVSLMECSPNLAIERMGRIEITKHDSIKKLFNASRGHHAERNRNGNRNGNGNGKEWIFHEAMMAMKSIGFWVCGIVLSGLNSDVKPIMEITRDVLFMDSSLLALDSICRKKFMEAGGILQEFERVNESVRLIVSRNGDSDGGIELKTRLEVLGFGLKGLREEEEGLFGTVMAARNTVLETLRTRNNH